MRKMKQKLLFTFALLLMAVTGAWAESTYTVNLKSEYSSVPTIYAGVQNYFTLEVTNTVAASNVVVELYLGDELIQTKTIESLAADEKKTLDLVDETIRPITENTVIGNSNENAKYKVVVKENEVVKKQEEFSFVILYNGNLGKDYEYPCAEPTLRGFSFIGDVHVLTQDVGTYMTASATSRDDVFTVDLGEGKNIYKAFLYVSYNWDKVADGDFLSWETKFNSESIMPTASYRDQSNLGASGAYGYGLVVYDVTGEILNGENTFHLKKPAGNVAVYPSALIVMTDNPSSTPKAVYIIEEADLLSHQYNKHVDAIYPSSFEGIASGDATLTVFAANAQSGEGDLIINGETYSDVWSGTSQTIDVYQTNVASGDLSVKFKSTGSSILALHQMLVVVEDDGTTSLSEKRIVKNEIFGTAPYYDLNGRRIENPTKGVFIHNGSKVIIK